MAAPQLVVWKSLCGDFAHLDVCTMPDRDYAHAHWGLILLGGLGWSTLSQIIAFLGCAAGMLAGLPQIDGLPNELTKSIRRVS